MVVAYSLLRPPLLVTSDAVGFTAQQTLCDPATVLVSWSDGTQTKMEVASGAAKAFNHTFRQAGEYCVEVRVYCKGRLATRDSLGNEASQLTGLLVVG